MLNLKIKTSTRIISIILAQVFLCASLVYPADKLRVPIGDWKQEAGEILGRIDHGDARKQKLLNKILKPEELKEYAFSEELKVYTKQSGRPAKYLPHVAIKESDLPYKTELRVIEPLSAMPRSLDELPRVAVTLPDEDIILVSLVDAGRAVVRLGFLADGRPVTVMSRPYEYNIEKSKAEHVSEVEQIQSLLKQVQPVLAVAQMGMGPRVYGVFKDQDGNWNLITDLVPGDFYDAPQVAKWITLVTIKDLQEINWRLRSTGYGIYGDFQAFVTPSGHMQVIDPEYLQADPSELEQTLDGYFDVLAFMLGRAEENVRFQALKIFNEQEPAVFSVFKSWIERQKDEGDSRRSLVIADASKVVRITAEPGKTVEESLPLTGTYVRKVEEGNLRLKLSPGYHIAGNRLNIQIVDTEKGILKIRKLDKGKAWVRIDKDRRLLIALSLRKKIERELKNGLFWKNPGEHVVLIGVGDGIEIWPEDEFKKQKGFKPDLNLLKFRNDSGHEIFSGTYNTMLCEGNRFEIMGDMRKKIKGDEVVLQVIPSQKTIRVFEKDAWLRFVRDEAPSDKIQLAEYNRAVFGSAYYGKMDEQYRIVIHEEIMAAVGFEPYKAIQLIGCGEYFEIYHPGKAGEQAADIMSDIIMPRENPLESFTGVHRCKIEEGKFRLQIPVHLTVQSKLRETSFLLQPMEDGCIRVFLADEWVEAVRKNTMGKPQAEAEAYLRRSFRGVFNVTSDNGMHVIIPKAVRDINGFDSKDIVLMGYGGFFEIWPAEIYESKKAGLHMDDSEIQSVFGAPMEVTPRYFYRFDDRHRISFFSDFGLAPGQQHVLVQPVYGQQRAAKIFINLPAWQENINQHLASLNDLQSRIDFLRKVFGSVYACHIDSQNRLTLLQEIIREQIGEAKQGGVEVIRYNDGSFELRLQPSAISGSTLLSFTPGKESRRSL